MSDLPALSNFERKDSMQRVRKHRDSLTVPPIIFGGATRSNHAPYEENETQINDGQTLSGNTLGAKSAIDNANDVLGANSIISASLAADKSVTSSTISSVRPSIDGTAGTLDTFHDLHPIPLATSDKDSSINNQPVSRNDRKSVVMIHSDEKRQQNKTDTLDAIAAVSGEGLNVNSGVDQDDKSNNDTGKNGERKKSKAGLKQRASVSVNNATALSNPNDQELQGNAALQHIEQNKTLPHFKGRFTIKSDKDIQATVGSYNPYPMFWTSLPAFRKKKGAKDVWSRMTIRFKEVEDTKLSPGKYNPPSSPFKNINGVQSAFKSNGRFQKRKQTANQPAPGSYNIEPLKIRHGFIPWVKDVHKDLKRVIEPPGKTTWATPSKLLEILSTDEEYKFADKCNKVDFEIKPVESRKSVASNAIESVKKSQHPFSAVFLIKPNK